MNFVGNGDFREAFLLKNFKTVYFNAGGFRNGDFSKDCLFKTRYFFVCESHFAEWFVIFCKYQEVKCYSFQPKLPVYY